MVLCGLLAAKFLFQSDLHILKQQLGQSEQLPASFLCSAQYQSDTVLFQSSYLLYGNRCQIATINGAQTDLKCVANIYKHGTSAVRHKWGSVGVVFNVLIITCFIFGLEITDSLISSASFDLLFCFVLGRVLLLIEMNQPHLVYKLVCCQHIAHRSLHSINIVNLVLGILSRLFQLFGEDLWTSHQV